MERRFVNKAGNGISIDTIFVGISEDIKNNIIDGFIQSGEWKEVFPVAYKYNGVFYYKKVKEVPIYFKKGDILPLALKKLKDAAPYWNESDIPKEENTNNQISISHLTEILQLEMQYLTELIQKMPERIMKEMKNRE